MLDYLLSLPTWFGCGLTMVSTALSGLLIYVVSNKLITTYKSEDLKAPSSSLFRVVGLLLSLMLSLAFGEVIVDLVTIRNSVEREVAAISDTYKNLRLYDIETTREIQTVLLDYTKAVIDDDWPALAKDVLGQRAGGLEQKLSEAVLNLKPITPMQEKLWSRIIDDVDLMSDYRLTRLDSAVAELPVYIYVIFFGFLVAMACFGSHRPQSPLIVLILLYNMFIGWVLYLIMTLSDPFQGIGVQPTSFEHLVEKLQSGIR
jgi:hypothetical protein